MIGRKMTFNRAAESVPPQMWFGVSAIFHYLGPSFAVLLFPAVGVLGVAWFRIASAALIFAPFTKPWRTINGWCGVFSAHERSRLSTGLSRARALVGR